MLNHQCLSISAAVVVIVALLGATGLRAAEPALLVEPSRVELRGNYDRVQLLVRLSGEPEERALDLTTRAEFTSSDPTVVTVSKHGQLLAAADGTATITVNFENAQQAVQVTVADVAATPSIDFMRQVLPILSKRGCNGGGCHGGQYGKGGLEALALRFPAFR